MKQYFKKLIKKIERLSKPMKTFIGGTFCGFLVGLLSGGFVVAAIMGSVIMNLK